MLAPSAPQHAPVPARACERCRPPPPPHCTPPPMALSRSAGSRPPTAAVAELAAQPRLGERSGARAGCADSGPWPCASHVMVVFGVRFGFGFGGGSSPGLCHCMPPPCRAVAALARRQHRRLQHRPIPVDMPRPPVRQARLSFTLRRAEYTCARMSMEAPYIRSHVGMLHAVGACQHHMWPNMPCRWRAHVVCCSVEAQIEDLFTFRLQLARRRSRGSARHLRGSYPSPWAASCPCLADQLGTSGAPALGKFY